MQYKLVIPTDFFGDRLNCKMLQGIVRDLRPLGISLQFDIPGLEMMIEKESCAFGVEEFDAKVAEIRDLFIRHCKIDE